MWGRQVRMAGRNLPRIMLRSASPSQAAPRSGMRPGMTVPSPIVFTSFRALQHGHSTPQVQPPAWFIQRVA